MLKNLILNLPEPVLILFIASLIAIGVSPFLLGQEANAQGAGPNCVASAVHNPGDLMNRMAKNNADGYKFVQFAQTPKPGGAIGGYVFSCRD